MKLAYEIRFEEFFFIYHWLTGYGCDWISTYIYHLPLVHWIHIQPTDRYVSFSSTTSNHSTTQRLRREIASVPRSTLERLLEGESLWCVWNLGRCRHIRQPNPSKKKVRRIMLFFDESEGIISESNYFFRLVGGGILRFLRLEAFRLPKWIFWKVKVWLLQRSRDFSEVHIQQRVQ